MKHLSWTMRATMLLLTGLLMITSVAGKSLAMSTKKPVSEQKTTKKQNNERPTIVQELSADAVVTPAVSYDFSQDFYFLPLPQYSLLDVSVSIPKRFDTFYYFFSFFRNVFGHHIAINAP